VRGHRLQRQWADDPDVCSVYEVDLETPAGTEPVLMSEWHTARDGQLASGRLVFDTASSGRSSRSSKCADPDMPSAAAW
jgi:hypothetical protein